MVKLPYTSFLTQYDSKSSELEISRFFHNKNLGENLKNKKSNSKCSKNLEGIKLNLRDSSPVQYSLFVGAAEQLD